VGHAVIAAPERIAFLINCLLDILIILDSFPNSLVCPWIETPIAHGLLGSEEYRYRRILSGPAL
jgi:hypothetical protein